MRRSEYPMKCFFWKIDHPPQNSKTFYGKTCVVHPRPQTPQGKSAAKPETPLLTILILECKSDVKKVDVN